MDFEELLKVFFAIILAAMGISQARLTFPDISKASGAVQRVFSILDRTSAINAFDASGTASALLSSLIALQMLFQLRRGWVLQPPAPSWHWLLDDMIAI